MRRVKNGNGKLLNNRFGFWLLLNFFTLPALLRLRPEKANVAF
jgi:hypothetical protein